MKNIQTAIFLCLFPLLWGACCTKPVSTEAESGEWAKVPAILQNIVPPVFPDTVYNVMNYGAKNDTTFDSRPAILEAINLCNANGGGTVLVPAGNYFIKAST